MSILKSALDSFRAYFRCDTVRSEPTGSHFYRAMLCIRGTSHGPVSVCLSVSVTSRRSTKMVKLRITQTTPKDRSGTLSFLTPKISAKFDRDHPLRGRQMQVGWLKICDFRRLTGYISKMVLYRCMVHTLAR